jgi:hypothetical protein
MDNMDKVTFIKDFIMTKPTKKYETENNINLWLNFFVSDLFNFRTKQLCLANQFSINNYNINFIVFMSKLLSNVTPISIGGKNFYSKYSIPPLTKFNNIDRTNIQNNLILVYSTSGRDFPNTLFKIANKNKDYKFKFFSDKKYNKQLYDNIEFFKPSKKKFNYFITKCSCVLSTAGNELTLECVYNNIPIAIMPCSNTQFEQVYNITKYVEELKYAKLMNENLNLDELKNNNIKLQRKNLHKLIQNREKIIIDLIENI